MSGLQVFARTNHFRVRDLDVLEALLKGYEVKLYKDTEGDAPRATIVGNDGDTGDFPSRLQPTDELFEFAVSVRERYENDKVDVALKTDEELLDELRRRCDLEGFTASKHDLEQIIMIVRAEDPEEVEIDFASLVAPFIADGEVMVLHVAGMEGNLSGPRSVFGHAEALINTGEKLTIDIYDIYKQAEQKFGIKPRYVGT